MFFGKSSGRLVFWSFSWVKSGKFGHQVNSDTRLQTVEILMRWLLMSGNPDETAPYEPFHQDFHCLLS